jgi:nucleoside-diphosphate-sugar epimerase
MQTLLITGADGFTGQHLTLAAQAAGYRVHPLVADITDAAAVMDEVAAITPTHLIHLAAISAVTHKDEAAIYRVNLFGTINLLNALAALPYQLGKVLLVSSANVYGNTTQSPITEDCCPIPVNHYAISKLAMEYMAATFTDKLPIVIARPFNYTGVGHDGRFVIPKLIQHFAQRAPTIALGNLQVEREFNDVRTVCNAYLKLLTQGKTGQAYNICSGRGVSLQTVINTLCDLTNHTPEIIVNPDFVRPNEVHRLCGSPTKLEACTGILGHPTLRETLEWMLQSAANQ